MADIQDEIVPHQKLKQLLALCERAPLGCAFGLTKDKKECLLLVDKRAKPKKVQTLLKAEGKAFLDMPTLRFGRVEVDVKNDPGTLKFTVNRSEAGGTMMTLVKLAKKCGYQAIVINVNDVLENESEEDDEAEGDTVAPPPAPPPMAPQIDAAALKARLADLFNRLKERLPHDPAGKDALMELAKHANIMLGTNNLKTATADADNLEAMLDAPLPQPTEGDAASNAQISANTGAVAFAKSRLAWISVRRMLESDIDKLRDKVLEHYKDADIADDLNRNYNNRVEPMMNTLDETLSDILDDAINATDPQKRAALVAQARDTIKRYQDFVASEPLFGDLDNNPFLPLTIRATVTKALSAISAAVR